MHLKVIGAGGFVGKKLVSKLLDSQFQVSTYNRMTSKFDVIHSPVPALSSLQNGTQIVINLAGAWHKVNDRALIDANWRIPLQILENEIAVSAPMVWIQASSYYQIYEDLYGKPKDRYSELKKAFTEELKGKASENLKILDLVLPHIIGPGEPVFRVFSMLAEAELTKVPVSLSSGSSILPLLDVRDLAGDIYAKVLEIYCGEKSLIFERCFPGVSELESLRFILERRLNIDPSLMNFSSQPDREREFKERNSLSRFYKMQEGRISVQQSYKDQKAFLSI